MALLRLNPDGLATKLKQLYKLHATDRELIAEIITDDFKQYIDDNFLLTTEQSQYLEKLDPIFCRYIGAQCAICLKHKLPIELKVMVPPTEEGFTTRTIFGNQILLSSMKGSDKIVVEGKLKFTVCHTYDNSYLK